MHTIILQHEPTEGPGRLRAALPEPVRTVRVFAGEPIPALSPEVAGILTLGGEMNVGDPLPWIVEEQALLRDAHHAGVPILGVCLGSQLLATALGGQVGPMAAPEMGWHPVYAVAPDPLLDGLSLPMMQFHAHGHEVTALPPGGSVFLASAACAVQGWRVGPRTVGLQLHCEWDTEQIRAQHDDPVALRAHFSRYAALGEVLAARLSATFHSAATVHR